MGRDLKVLILEDQSSDAELIIDGLRQAGFDPDWERVETKEQYVARLRPDLDVILADYVVARFNAMEALRLLQARDLDIPFVVITGVTKGEDAVACLRQGADDYLLKDRLERLGPVVEHVLETKRLGDERRAARRDARISTRQWQATFNAINDPLFLLDAGGRIVRCNQAAVAFIGQPRTEIIGHQCCEMLHGASEMVERCPYFQALESQERASHVWQKEDRWLEATVDPMLDEDGYLIGFVHLLEDITKRKEAEEAIGRRARELKLLNRAGHAFNASLDLDEVLGTVLEEVRRVLGVAGCSIWLRDPDTRALICRQASGPQGDTVRGWRLAPGEGIVGWVVSHGKSSIVADAQTDERHFEDVDEQTGLGLRSILTVPLRSEGDTIGALQAVDEATSRFSAGDATLLKSLAASATLAIQKAQMYERAQDEIVERRRAEAAQREAEARYRTLFEETPIGLYRSTPEGEILDANPALAAMLGYSDQESFLKANAFTFYLDPEDRKRRLKALESCGTWESVEVRLRRRDGEIIRVLDTGRAVRDDQGEICYYNGALRDITERKRAEEQAHFQASLLDAVGEAVIASDPTGTVIYWNEAAEGLYGWSEEEVLDRNVLDVTPALGSEERATEIMERLKTGERWTGDFRVQRQDGTTFHALVTNTPVQDEHGKLTAIIGVSRDITARKDAERRLRESEEDFRALAEHNPDIVARFDEDVRYLYVSPAVSRYVELTPDELIGKTNEELGFTGETVEIWEAPIRRAFDTGKPQAFEFEFESLQGRTVFDGRIAPEVGEDGRVETVLSAVRDITEQRQAEEALEQRLAELALLNEMGNQITRALGLEAVLESAVEIVQRSFGYHNVAVLTLDQDNRKLTLSTVAGRFADIMDEGLQMDLEEGLIGWVACHGETVVVNNVEADPRYVNCYPDQIHTQSELSVPICIADDVVGVLDVQSEEPGAFEENDVTVMETVADQMAVALENGRLYKAERAARRQLRDLASYLQNIREEERTRIAREIHDEFGQMMTALKMDLAWLRKRLPQDEPDLLRKADAMSEAIDETLQDVRRIASELRPGILDDLGLAAAIEWQAETFSERSGIVCELHLDEEGDHLDRQLVTALFRILQEALTNVARHARASRVRVGLDVAPIEVTLTVRDDGRGITEKELTDGESLGLMGMRERAHTLGGSVTFEGHPNGGTSVTTRIPRRGHETRRE